MKRRRILFKDLTWGAQQAAERLLKPQQEGELRPGMIIGEFRPSCGMRRLLTWDMEMVFMCVEPSSAGEWRYYRWR